MKKLSSSTPNIVNLGSKTFLKLTYSMTTTPALTFTLLLITYALTYSLTLYITLSQARLQHIFTFALNDSFARILYSMVGFLHISEIKDSTPIISRL